MIWLCRGALQRVRRSWREALTSDRPDLHWDGKHLPAISGEQIVQERIAVLVTGESPLASWTLIQPTSLPRRPAALSVVNDAAERITAIFEKFNNSITQDEQQKQYLLKLVHRHLLMVGHKKADLVKKVFLVSVRPGQVIGGRVLIHFVFNCVPVH